MVEELHLGTTAANDTFTTFVESGAFGKMCYNSFVTAPFWQTGPNGEVEPFLVTDWTVSEDSTTITCDLALDQGITWHDGEPLTMDDVLFTFDYNINVRKSSYGSYVDHAEQVDEDTIKVVLKEPGAYQWLKLVAGYFYVQPKHIWENIDAPKDYRGEDAVIGCGPYKLVQVDEEAQTMHYEAVGETYMGRALTVRSVTVRSYDSQDALVMALRTGEVDAMYDYSNPISPTMLPSISGVDGVDPGKGMNMGLFEILFGFQKQPTDDLEFRRAVRYALNYELLATTIGGEDGQVPGEGIISPAGIGYDDSLPKLVQDQEQAKAILEAAGYIDTDGDGWREQPDGTPMDVLVTPQYNATKAALYQRIAEIIVTNLGEVGVKCTLDEESIRNSDHEQQLRDDGAYEIYICYATQGVSFYKTPFLYMFNDDLSMWGTCDLEDFDQAYNDMLNAQGDEDYVAKVKELQRIASEEVIGIALCWDTAYYPYRTDKYEGWTNFPGWGVINFETWYNLHPIG